MVAPPISWRTLSGGFAVIYVKDDAGADGGRPHVPDHVALTLIGDDYFDETGFSRSASTSPRVPPICCGPTSICAHGGGALIPLPWLVPTKGHCRGERCRNSSPPRNLPILTTAYVALVEARRNPSEAEAAALDARLVLILANHIGDLDVLREAIALAKQSR